MNWTKGRSNTVRFMESELKKYCQAVGHSFDMVTGPCRKAELVLVRKIFYYNMRKEGFGLRLIGEVVGGRDYTTVINGLNSYKNLKATNDPQLKFYLNTIINNYNN